MNIASLIIFAAGIALTLHIPASADVQAWFVPSAKKVMRDEKFVKDAGKWELAAAKNEVEACQVVLLADKAVDDVKVTVSELRQSRGKGALRADLNRVEYVPVNKENIPFPDPLPPLAGLKLEPNKAQPVWISVRVPKNAAAGVYRGAVRVEAAGRTIEMPLSVKVWDFTLPVTPSCVTAFGINWEWIAPQHKLSMDSAEFLELKRKYYEFLLDHKASPYTLPVDFMSDEAAKYLNDPRVTSFVIPTLQNDDDLKALMKRLREGGWLKKGFFYPMDEPARAEQFPELERIVNRLRAIEPNARITVPFDKNPPFDDKHTSFELLFGKVNVWCPGSWLWDDANVWFPQRGKDTTLGPSLAARQNAGDDVWWYVCCNPGRPYANFWTNQSAMEHRILFWQQKMKGVQGLLYWSTTWWNPGTGCPDPWKIQTTFTTINPDMYGDGSLMYPGKQVGVDGPVSSQRMEVIRDGIEDFDYLTLADQRLGKGASKPYIDRLVRSLTDYDKDPVKLEGVRRELGDAIEKATVEARKRL